MNDRTLRLKREVLTEIDSAALAAVGGGDDITRHLRETVLNTCFSCLPYISCNPAACIVRDALEDLTQAQFTVAGGC